MLSKAQVKDIRGLATVKGRAEAGAFMVEGDKMVREWLGSKAPLHLLAATKEWLDVNSALIKNVSIATLIATDAEDLARASSLSTPQHVFIIAPLPSPPSQLPMDEWTLVLDDIQDPGNVGTLIRIADWFGIGHIVASHGCADFFNQKVVQAAMGGHLRIHLHKARLSDFLREVKMPIIAAALGGDDVMGFAKQKARRINHR